MSEPARRDIAALIAFIEARTALPHDFDGNDCVTHVLGASEAQFGVKVDPGVSWTTARGAKRTIAKLGGLEAAFDRFFDRIEPGMAQFGDIAGVIDPVSGFHVMLVEGQVLSAPGERRLDRVPRNRMVTAWHGCPKAGAR